MEEGEIVQKHFPLLGRSMIIDSFEKYANMSENVVFVSEAPIIVSFGGLGCCKWGHNQNKDFSVCVCVCVRVRVRVRVFPHQEGQWR